MMLFIYLIIIRPRLIIKIKYLERIAIICIPILITMIITDDFYNVLSYFNLIARIVVIAFAAIILFYDDVASIYLKIILFLSFSSLIYFTWLQIYPDIMYTFPTINGFGEAKYLNGVLYVLRIPVSNLMRNGSIFWEAGAFQAFINTAIAIELYKHGLHRVVRLTVYVGALITTFSTTGYLVFIGLISIYYWKSNIGKKNLISGLIFLPIVSSIIFITILSDVVINKFDSYNASLTTRVISSQTDLAIFSKSPIVGVGQGAYDTLVQEIAWGSHRLFLGGSVNSLTQHLAYYGVFFVFIVIFTHWSMLKALPLAQWERAFILVVILMIFSTQNFFTSSIWLFWGFRGYLYYITNKNKMMIYELKS